MLIEMRYGRIWKCCVRSVIECILYVLSTETVAYYINYSKFDKHQDLFFVFQGILVMEYPNSVTDMYHNHCVINVMNSVCVFSLHFLQN